MDENLSRGYVQLGRARGMNEMKLSNGNTSLSPPVDKFNLVYFALMLGGIGFLLPYNSFIIAVDYFQSRYPGTAVMFDMSLVYITMAFFAVIANNILIETLSLNTRITFGYLVAFVTLNFIVIYEIWWEPFNEITSYKINLLAVAVVSLGCTVQQSSFYGYTSMLPSQYTQAVMTGESIAGLWVSINRIMTKALVSDERSNTSMFFGLSNLTILTCFVLHQKVRKSDFVQFYIKLCQERNRITLEPTEDVGLMDPLDQVGDPTKGQYGVLKIQTSPPGNDAASANNTDVNGTTQYSAQSPFSFSNPVYEPGAPSGNPPGSAGPTYKVEDVVVMRGCGHGAQTSKPWSDIKKGVMARMEVAKIISPYMTTIGLAYFVTLCLYPGMMSAVISCKLGSWMPVILMTAFNTADVAGKMFALLPHEWKRMHLLVLAGLRFTLIPMFLFCILPKGDPVIPEWCPFLLSCMLGFTNGIVGSIPMMEAATKVTEGHRELAGNIMTMSYTSGLTFGTMFAYTMQNRLKIETREDRLCEDVWKLTSTATPFNSTMPSVVTNVVSSMLPTLETVASNATTAASILLTVLTSTVSSVTVSTSTVGVTEPSLTMVSQKLSYNVTASVNNSILQQH